MRSAIALAAMALLSAPVGAQNERDVSAWLMDEEYELALARSAAPETVTTEASYYVLREGGYEQVSTGTNGFACLVQRSFGAPFEGSPATFHNPEVIAPVCFNAEGTRTVMREHFLRAELFMAGENRDTIEAAVIAAVASGDIPLPAPFAISYMMSDAMFLGPGLGGFHVHLMLYAPYIENTDFGGHALFGHDPYVFEGAGGVFALATIALPHDRIMPDHPGYTPRAQPGGH